MGAPAFPERPAWGVGLALLAAAGFSTKAIFVKLAYPYGVDAITLLALRMGFALPAFLWIGLARTQAAALSAREWLYLGLLGFFGYYVAAYLDFWGLQYISAGLERIILFAYPTLTVLFGVVLHGRVFSWRREGAAFILAYAGIALAFAHDFDLGDGRDVVLGSTLVFGSCVLYAFYLSSSDNLIARLGASRFAALALVVASGATLLHFALTHPPSAFLLPPAVYGLSLVMAVLSTVLPVLALSAAIRRIGAGRAAVVGMAGPLMTVGFGWWFLGEAIALPQITGAALVIGAVVIIGRT